MLSEGWPVGGIPSAELRTGPSTELRTGNAWGCLIIILSYVRACKSRDCPPLWQDWHGFFLFSDYITWIIGWPEMSHCQGQRPFNADPISLSSALSLLTMPLVKDSKSNIFKNSPIGALRPLSPLHLNLSTIHLDAPEAH